MQRQRQPGRHALSTGLALLGGLWLLLQAFLFGHTSGHVVAFEAACGVLIVLSAVAALASPDLPVTARRSGHHHTRGHPAR